MNPSILTGPLAQAIGWALLHVLWQATAVAVVLAGALAALPRTGARIRYVLACASLALVVALGVTTAIRSYPAPAAPASAPVVRPMGTALPPSAIARLAPTLPERVRSFVGAASAALPTVVMLWLVGVALLSLRLVVEWLRVRRLVVRGAAPAAAPWQDVANRLSRALGVRRAVRVLESAAVEVPSVIGWLRPALLLPTSTLTGLTAAELEMIVAHELAHIRRHDFLVNLVQSVVETLLFYHPAVWWISRQVRIERENCCDDLAVAVCGDPMRYARALTRLEELRPRALPLAAAANGGSLLDRIRRIAGRSAASPGPASRGVAALAVLSCVVLTFAAPSLSAMKSWRSASKSDPHASHDAHVAEWPHHDAESGTDATDETPSHARSHSHLDADDRSDADAPEATDDDSSLSDDPESEASGDEPGADPGDDFGEAFRNGFGGGFHDFGKGFGRGFGDSDGDSESEEPGEPGERGKLTLDEIVQLRAMDVTPDLIRELRALFPGIEVRDIAGMKAVGATPEYVRALRSAGLVVDDAREAQGLAAVGVTPEFVRDMRSAGLAIDSPRDAQGLAAVGVTPDYVRRMRSAGLAVGSANDAQGLAAVGVTPELVRDLRAAGLDVGSANDAQGLAAVGVTPELIRGLRAAGLQVRSAREAQSLAAVGVTPDYVRELREAGVQIDDARDAQSLQALGVTPRFVRQLAKAGYSHLTVRDLQRLGASGMTGGFVREMSRYKTY